MKKKKENNLDNVDILSFEPRVNIGVKKNACDIMLVNKPYFYVSDAPTLSKKELLYDVKNQIYNLEIAKCLTIVNENTGLTMTQFMKKINNIIVGHVRKYVEKSFTTEKVNSKTFRITRNKNKIITQ